MSSENSNRHLRQLQPLQSQKRNKPFQPVQWDTSHSDSLTSASPSPYTIPPHILAEHASLTRELPAWNDAFTPLLTEVLLPGAKLRDRISALMMELAALASHICLHCGYFIRESSYDIFLPDFKQIVDYALLLVEAQRQEQVEFAAQRGELKHVNAGKGGNGLGFAFDAGLIPPLYLTVTKCRDRLLRLAALEILENHPRREGVWDTVVIAAVSRWVMELEEKAREEQDEGARAVLLEERRVRKIAVKFDLVRRKAAMSCLQFVEESNDGKFGEWVKREKVHSW